MKNLIKSVALLLSLSIAAPVRAAGPVRASVTNPVSAVPPAVDGLAAPDAAALPTLGAPNLSLDAAPTLAPSAPSAESAAPAGAPAAQSAAVAVESAVESAVAPQGGTLKEASQAVTAVSENEAIQEMSRPQGSAQAASGLFFDGTALVAGRSDAVAEDALATASSNGLSRAVAGSSEGLPDFEARLAAIRKPDAAPSALLGLLGTVSAAAVLVAGFASGLTQQLFGADAAMRLQLLAYALAAPAVIIGLKSLELIGRAFSSPARAASGRAALMGAAPLAFLDGDPRNMAVAAAAFVILLLIASTAGSRSAGPSAPPLTQAMPRKAATGPERPAEPVRPILTTAVEQVVAVLGASLIWGAFFFLPGLVEAGPAAEIKIRLVAGLLGLPAGIAGLAGLGGLVARLFGRKP